MAFKELIRPGAKSKVRYAVSISAYQMRPGADHSVALFVAGDVARQTGLLPGIKVRISVGSLADDGLLRIMPATDGAWHASGLGSSRTGRIRIVLPGLLLGVVAKHDQTEAKFAVVDGGLELVLPTWAKRK